MTAHKSASLADVQRLEAENAQLKRKVAALAGGRQMLTDLRAITLQKENECIREILKLVGGDR